MLASPRSRTRAGTAGITEVDGRRTAYRRIRSDTGNANDWLVVASADGAGRRLLAGIGPAPLAMLAVALLIIVLAGVSLRAARRELEAHGDHRRADRPRQPPQAARRPRAPRAAAATPASPSC